MAVKKFILVDKTTHKVIYGGQVFETEAVTPVGLLGGWGQKDWYWVDVTNSDAGNFTNGKFNKTTRTPADGESIDVNKENVVVASEGTWA